MKAAAIFQSYLQNILQGATITASVTPMTGYAVADLGLLRPDFRVKWNTTTVTITWVLDAAGSPATPARGDLLVIPMSNLNGGGSPSGTIRIKNGAGLDQLVDFPANLGNGLAKTLVVDLSVLTPSAVTRTSDTWQLEIRDNPDNVVIGGAIAIYSPKTYLANRDFQWEYVTRKTSGMFEVSNPYLTRFRQTTGTQVREIDASTIATDDDADALELWHEENCGRTGFLWFDPNIVDGYLGTVQEPFERQRIYTDANAIRVSFAELSKGLPIT